MRFRGFVSRLADQAFPPQVPETRIFVRISVETYNCRGGDFGVGQLRPEERALEEESSSGLGGRHPRPRSHTWNETHSTLTGESNSGHRSTVDGLRSTARLDTDVSYCRAGYGGSPTTRNETRFSAKRDVPGHPPRHRGRERKTRRRRQMVIGVRGNKGKNGVDQVLNSCRCSGRLIRLDL